jgi:hypothetical protein
LLKRINGFLRSMKQTEREGIEVLNNCPECKTGVMEPLGYIEVKTGPVTIHFGSEAPSNEPAIAILMCSKEICGCVHFEGSPGTLRFVNELRRSMKTIKMSATG